MQDSRMYHTCYNKSTLLPVSCLLTVDCRKLFLYLYCVVNMGMGVQRGPLTPLRNKATVIFTFGVVLKSQRTCSILPCLGRLGAFSRCVIVINIRHPLRNVCLCTYIRIYDTHGYTRIHMDTHEFMRLLSQKRHTRGFATFVCRAQKIRPYWQLPMICFG